MRDDILAFACGCKPSTCFDCVQEEFRHGVKVPSVVKTRCLLEAQANVERFFFSLSILRYIVQTERKFNNVFALLASWRCEMKKMKVRLAMEYRYYRTSSEI